MLTSSRLAGVETYIVLSGQIFNQLILNHTTTVTINVDHLATTPMVNMKWTLPCATRHRLADEQNEDKVLLPVGP